MGEIERYDVSEEWAHSGIIKAGDFCFLEYDVCSEMFGISLSWRKS